MQVRIVVKPVLSLLRLLALRQMILHLHTDKLLYRSLNLHLLDDLVLLIPVFGLDSLPRQSTLQKVDEYEA